MRIRRLVGVPSPLSAWITAGWPHQRDRSLRGERVELDLTPHVEKRMEDRGFTEVDLREMLERASGFRRDVMDGR